MKKTKILLYHFFVFIAGAITLAVYFVYKIAMLPAKAAIVGVALIPVGIVYIIGFGVLCFISFIVFFVFLFFRRRKIKKISNEEVF